MITLLIASLYFRYTFTDFFSRRLGPVLLADATLTDPKRKTTHYRVTQGLEMGSPSTLLGRVVASDDGTRTAKECWCGGGAVKIGEGWIAVPPAE